VAKLAREGEGAFNMFAGVGCFPIILAKLKRVEVGSGDYNLIGNQPQQYSTHAFLVERFYFVSVLGSVVRSEHQG
jgi:hypothetical protein